MRRHVVQRRQEGTARFQIFFFGCGGGGLSNASGACPGHILYLDTNSTTTFTKSRVLATYQLYYG